MPSGGSRALLTRPQRNKNTGLPAGVYRYYRERELRDGTVVRYLVFTTRTTVNGKNVITTFSCGRCPVSRATLKTRGAEAIAHRQAWEARVQRKKLGL